MEYIPYEPTMTNDLNNQGIAHSMILESTPRDDWQSMPKWWKRLSGLIVVLVEMLVFTAQTQRQLNDFDLLLPHLKLVSERTL